MDKVVTSIDTQRALIKLEEDELHEAMTALHVKISILQEKLSRLDKAKAAILGQSVTAMQISQPAKTKPAKESGTGSLTIKEMVMLVLEDVDEGMTALDILTSINNRFNKSYERTSLSPQLSRLVQASKIYRMGKVYLKGPIPLFQNTIQIAEEPM